MNLKSCFFAYNSDWMKYIYIYEGVSNERSFKMRG